MCAPTARLSGSRPGGRILADIGFRPAALVATMSVNSHHIEVGARGSSLMSACERDQIDQAVHGDETALISLLEQYAPQIRRELRLETHWLSKFDLDDVMQVTFLEAFLHIRRFDPDASGPFAGWLLCIAKNNLRDLIKEVARDRRPPPAKQVQCVGGADSYVGLIDVLSDSTWTTPSRNVAAEEAKRVLDDAIARLPTVYEQVIRLFDLEGRSADQVAEAVGRSPGAVYMVRARAHDQLRGILGAESKFFSHHA